MPRIELAPEVGEDLDRIFDCLAQYEVADAPAHIQDIIQAISVLEYNPLIGSPAKGDMRELIIGRRERGYVALYRYIAEMDAIFVLALRSPREAGYAGL